MGTETMGKKEKEKSIKSEVHVSPPPPPPPPPAALSPIVFDGPVIKNRNPAQD